MRLYSRTHDFSCGIDLHARTMYLCVLDRAGQTLLHRNLPTRPEALLDALAPFRSAISSSAASVSSPGTGSPISASMRAFRSLSATLSACARFTA